MNPATDWSDQQAFLAVLEEGSLSAAARRLGLTQPTVRSRIEALEHRLGTVLFVRSGSGMTPTRAGAALRASAQAMAQASAAFTRAASSTPGTVTGVVRLSVSEFVGGLVLPAMLPTLRARHPGLLLETELSNAPAALLDQQADIAVRMHTPRQGALVARQVPSIPLGLYASKRYLARRGVPADFDALAAHDLIGPDRSMAELALVAERLPRVDMQRLVFRTDSHVAQFAAVQAGVGIGVVQCPVADRDAGLVRVLPAVQVAALDTWIVMHENLRHEPRIRAVFDWLVESFTVFVEAAPTAGE